MFRGYWFAAVAFGLIAFVSLGQAQEQQSRPDKETNQKDQPPENVVRPFRVEIVEGQDQSESRRKREAEADQREINDLIAQQGMNAATQAMNDATQRMAKYAFWSAWLTLGGLIALVVTLWFTRRALNVARQELMLSHPPRFKITRPIVFKEVAGQPESFDILPDFKRGDTVNGRAFLVNYGRYDAMVTKADCYFHFAKGGSISMAEAYNRYPISDEDTPPLKQVIPPITLPTIKSGQHAFWDITGIVPTDFRKAKNGDWSHTLYIMGLVQYIGAAKDRRGYYYCKRYLPKERRFEDAPEYENED